MASEIELVQFFQGFSSPALDYLMIALTQLGNPFFWLLLTAVVYWSGRDREALGFANLVLFSSMAVGVLKHSFGKLRPPLVSDSVRAVIPIEFGPLAFPSGHATLAGAFFGYFLKYKKLFWSLGLGAGVLVVAVSRVYLGMHFVSDVLAGAVLGLVIGMLNIKLSERIAKAKLKLSLWKEELLVFGLIAASILLLIYYRESALPAAFIGFYAGFFTLKEVEYPHKCERGKSLWVKEGLGLAGIGALLLAYFFSGSFLLEFALMGLAGLWISFIWPLIFDHSLKGNCF